MRLLEHRKELANMRKLLHQEELGLQATSHHSLQLNVNRGKQRALEKILDAIEENRSNADVEVLKAEGDLLKHYSQLLKTREQIERLLMDEKPQEKKILTEEQKLLDEEIHNVKLTFY